MEDALTLAATPATSAEAALRKATFIEAALQAWIMPDALHDGHENAVGILTVAARRERDRWSVERSAFLSAFYGDRV